MAAAILATSTVLQFVSAFMALRLMRVTRHRTAWVLIAAAILLMAFRRSITLARIATGDVTWTADPAAETVALLISVLMVAGVSRIAPLFGELQRSAVEISKSQRQLQDILDHTPAAVYVKDRSGRFILVNQRVARAAGTSHDAAAGKTDLELFPREIAEQNMRNDARVLDERRPIEFDEARVHSDGTHHEYLSLKFPLLDADGEPYAVCGISTDVTERRRVEREQRELESKLQEAQRLESLGVLAGGIAHDFNNLLVAIMGNVDLAQGHPAMPPEAREDLESALAATQAAAALCSQLLVYAGRGTLQTTPVDLSHLVEEMSRLMDVSVSKKGRLERHLAPDLPLIEADSSQLQQVVMNLVANASDALADESGTVTLTTRRVTIGPDGPKHLRVGEALAPGQYVCLEVRDTGSGMTEETRRRLFEPFYTTKFTGRGLGLAAVGGIVRSHGGAIRVASTPGAGSTFEVYFPAARESEAPASSLPERSEPRAVQGTVLVVDDEKVVRDLATRALERAGLRVKTADNGREAVETYRRCRGELALVVLDLTMPEMDGYQVFAELQRMDSSVPVLLSSGYDEESMDRDRLASGFAGFVQKPYRVQVLVDAVREAIARDEAKRRPAHGSS